MDDAHIKGIKAQHIFTKGARIFLRKAATRSSIALGASDGEGVRPDEGEYTPCDEAGVKFETESAP